MRRRCLLLRAASGPAARSAGLRPPKVKKHLPTRLQSPSLLCSSTTSVDTVPATKHDRQPSRSMRAPPDENASQTSRVTATAQIECIRTRATRRWGRQLVEVGRPRSLASMKVRMTVWTVATMVDCSFFCAPDCPLPPFKPSARCDLEAAETLPVRSGGIARACAARSTSAGSVAQDGNDCDRGIARGSVSAGRLA